MPSSHYLIVFFHPTCLISRKDKRISTILSGIIDCTSRLSLIPDITLALSPPTIVSTPSFHPCIRLSRWTKSPGTVSFIPPDGSFTLLEYGTPEVSYIDLPFRVETKLEDTGDFEIRLMPGGKKIDDLTVTIPLNSTITGTANTRPSRGDFFKTSSSLVWTIPKDKTSAGVLGAGRPGYALKGQFTGDENLILPSNVVVQCACQGWLASGISVSGLRVAGTGVPDGVGSGKGGIYKGVKGITKVQVIVRL
jgi:AP-3 complex subunit mu